MSECVRVLLDRIKYFELKLSVMYMYNGQVEMGYDYFVHLKCSSSLP